MIRRPPRSSRLPDTTLFRSQIERIERTRSARDDAAAQAKLDALRSRAAAAANLLQLSVDVARARCMLGEISAALEDRKSTRLNSSHANISYAVFCLSKTLTG